METCSSSWEETWPATGSPTGSPMGGAFTFLPDNKELRTGPRTAKSRNAQKRRARRVTPHGERASAHVRSPTPSRSSPSLLFRVALRAPEGHGAEPFHLPAVCLPPC